jgi:hypothetical protein
VDRDSQGRYNGHKEGFSQELDTMFQVEATIIKAEIKINQERMEAKIEAT